VTPDPVPLQAQGELPHWAVEAQAGSLALVASQDHLVLEGFLSQMVQEVIQNQALGRQFRIRFWWLPLSLGGEGGPLGRGEGFSFGVQGRRRTWEALRWW
jgi:hypothetical protein